MASRAAAASKRARSANRPMRTDCARRQVQRDVAAVVDPGARRRRRAGSSRSAPRATEPATAAIGVMKPARYGRQACHMRRATTPCSGQSAPRTGARSSGSSATSSASTVCEPPPGRSCAAATAARVAVGADHDVDRAVLEVPAAVRAAVRVARSWRRRAFSPAAAAAPSGQGLPVGLRTQRRAGRRAVVVPGAAAQHVARACAHGPCGRRARGSRPAAC